MAEIPAEVTTTSSSVVEGATAPANVEAIAAA